MKADAIIRQARGLVLRDRAAAREALAGLREAEIDEKLDALEAEERERAEHEAAEAARAKRRDEALGELRKIREKQHAAAARFDGAVAVLEEEFDALEALNVEADAAARRAGVEGRRDFAARTAALTRSAWRLAPSLAKRLRLAGVPGGRSRAAPLADAYPLPKE